MEFAFTINISLLCGNFQVATRTGRLYLHMALIIGQGSTEDLRKLEKGSKCSVMEPHWVS